MAASTDGRDEAGFQLEAELVQLRRARRAFELVSLTGSPSVGLDGGAVRALEALQATLTETGQWVAGPATLYGVLGLTGRELERCRVLKWALDPLGAHALGTRVLERFLLSIGFDQDVLETAELGRTEVLLEQVRANSRADLVLVSDSWTVVIEAKVHAGEQPQQGARLETDWPDATYVFLTNQGRPMQSAGPTTWQSLRWATLHACISEAVLAAGPAPTLAAATARAGLRDYLIAVRHLEHHDP